MDSQEAVVSETGAVQAVEVNPAELLAQMGQVIATMESVNPAVAKQLRAQQARFEKTLTKVQDIFPAYDEVKLEEGLSEFHSDYQNDPTTTEFLMVRGSEVRRMKVNRDNFYMTPTGIKKILQPARENSAGVNPQALAITINSDGTFSLEPSHAGVDYQIHLQNRWK